jgi:hypothetical protein
MLPPAAERPKLRATLDQLAGAVEDLLLGGLTTATEDTKSVLAGAMQEAARVRALRLSATLRQLLDDLGRFSAHDKLLSPRRLTLFLNRSWVLARGLSRALVANDEAGYDRLNHTPTTQPLKRVEVVCLGAVKKATAAVAQFEFRCRAVADAAPVKAGDPVRWSFTQPVKTKEFPAEAFLHLPQKQKFPPFCFLARKAVAVEKAVGVRDDSGAWRLQLTDDSTVTPGEAFDDWERFVAWTPAVALERIARQTPGPLDLDTELQEEIVLTDYTIEPTEDGDEPGQTVCPVKAGPVTFRAVLSSQADGKAAWKVLEELRKSKKARPPLFGLMHYERCRLVLQPLSTFEADGPNYLTISPEKVDKAALLKALF